MKNVSKHNRRNFLKAGLVLSSTSFIAAPLLSEVKNVEMEKESLKENYAILFQGDSITDGNRTRDNDWNHLMGHGYVYLVASRLWYEFPEKRLKIYNRGVSGNKITDLEQRWESDTLALKPDLVSILIGINDTSAFINGDKNSTPEQFEDKYRQILNNTKTRFQSVQFVLCEPFMLPVGQVKSKLEEYSVEIKKRQEIVYKLATEFDAVYIPFQDVFNRALKRAPADYWIWDGIHPMPAGHEIMALEWMQWVKRKLKLKIS